MPDTDTAALYALLADGRDATEDESAAIKRYLRTHPDSDPLAAQLADRFPVESDEVHAESPRIRSEPTVNVTRPSADTARS